MWGLHYVVRAIYLIDACYYNVGHILSKGKIVVHLKLKFTYIVKNLVEYNFNICLFYTHIYIYIYYAKKYYNPIWIIFFYINTIYINLVFKFESNIGIDKSNDRMKTLPMKFVNISHLTSPPKLMAGVTVWLWPLIKWSFFVLMIFQVRYECDNILDVSFAIFTYSLGLSYYGWPVFDWIGERI